MIIQIRYTKCQLDDCLEVDKVDHQFLVCENPLEIQQQQNKIEPLKSISKINIKITRVSSGWLTCCKSYPTGVRYNITIPMWRSQQNNGSSYTYTTNENTD